jgi:hypothetical protein
MKNRRIGIQQFLHPNTAFVKKIRETENFGETRYIASLHPRFAPQKILKRALLFYILQSSFTRYKKLLILRKRIFKNKHFIFIY